MLNKEGWENENMGNGIFGEMYLEELEQILPLERGRGGSPS